MQDRKLGPPEKDTVFKTFSATLYIIEISPKRRQKQESKQARNGIFSDALTSLD